MGQTRWERKCKYKNTKIQKSKSKILRKTGSQEIGQTRVERKCKWKPKAGKFNIHRHYSSPTICKTSKKLEFHKLSFQKMFRWECNLNISKKDICGVNSGNLFLHLHWFEIGAWIRVSIHLPAPWGEILTRPVTDHQGFTIALILYKNTKYTKNLQNLKI